MMSTRLRVRVPGTEVLGAREEVSMSSSTVSGRVREAESDQGPAPPVSLACTWNIVSCLIGSDNTVLASKSGGNNNLNLIPR